MYVIQKSSTYPPLREPLISYFKDCICGIKYYTDNIEDALKFHTKETAIWCHIDYIKLRSGEHIKYVEITDLEKEKRVIEAVVWRNEHCQD